MRRPFAALLPVLWAGLLAAACGARPGAVGPAPGHETPPPDASASASGATEGCAPTLRESARRSGCVLGAADACRYADGECGCQAHPQCGGARRPDPRPGDPGRWVCGSSDPTALDPAGCPYVAPREGSPCGREGTSCGYGPCSWSRTIATCQGGAWRVTHHMGPPPP